MKLPGPGRKGTLIPMEPLVRPWAYSVRMRSTSAKAMVTSVKKGPRRRKLGQPMAPATNVARRPPINMPIQGETPRSMNSRVEV